MHYKTIISHVILVKGYKFLPGESQGLVTLNLLSLLTLNSMLYYNYFVENNINTYLLLRAIRFNKSLWLSLLLSLLFSSRWLFLLPQSITRGLQEEVERLQGQLNDARDLAFSNIPIV